MGWQGLHCCPIKWKLDIVNAPACNASEGYLFLLMSEVRTLDLNYNSICKFIRILCFLSTEMVFFFKNINRRRDITC